MGALAHRSAHARPSAQAPINTSLKFSAHMSGRGGATIWVFQAILSTFHFFSENPPKKSTHGEGGRGVPPIFFTPHLIFGVT